MGGSLNISKDQAFKMTVMMRYKGNKIKNQNPYSNTHTWKWESTQVEDSRKVSGLLFRALPHPQWRHSSTEAGNDKIRSYKKYHCQLHPDRSHWLTSEKWRAPSSQPFQWRTAFHKHTQKIMKMSMCWSLTANFPSWLSWPVHWDALAS